MPSIYTIQASGFRSVGSDGASIFKSNTGAKVRPQVFAGPSSIGIVDADDNIALPASVQFGTESADPDGGNGGTAYTATPPNTGAAGMESGGSGAAPCLVEIASNGDQSMGYGRVAWAARTKFLRLEQRAGDALISNNPRTQCWSHFVASRGAYYRVPVCFSLGDETTRWCPWISGKNTVLIFQMKGAAAYPPFDVQVRDAASGDTTKRDLYFLRRLTNAASGGFDSQGQNRVLIVADIALGVRYDFYLDVYMDFAGAGTGQSFLRIWRGSELQTLHSDVGSVTTLTADPLMYAATADVLQCMWGIYRLGYSSAQAPDATAIVYHEAGVYQYSGFPPSRLPTVRSAATSRGVLVGTRTTAAARTARS